MKINELIPQIKKLIELVEKNNNGVNAFEIKALQTVANQRIYLFIGAHEDFEDKKMLGCMRLPLKISGKLRLGLHEILTNINLAKTVVNQVSNESLPDTI